MGLSSSGVEPAGPRSFCVVLGEFRVNLYPTGTGALPRLMSPRLLTSLVGVRSLASRSGAAGERMRERIRRIDAEKAGRVLPLLDGGSLSTEHTTAQLASLCETAIVAELDPRDDEKRCFVLQHESEPSVRLAELWLLPPFPPGRFDAGFTGDAGAGLTLHAARTHDALPLKVAEPLVAHVISTLPGQHVEAVATLQGLSAWIASCKASEVERAFGAEVADAVLQMAQDGQSIIDYPSGLSMRTVARPAWELLATEYAQTLAAEEAAIYRAAGAKDVGVAYVADVSPEGLRESGGALALLAWQPSKDQ